MKEKKMLFITSACLASNPRLVKEMHLAQQSGFTITVVQMRFGNWADELTQQLKQEFPSATFIESSATRSPLFPWLLSTFFHWVCYKIPIQFLSFGMLAQAVHKRSWLLMNAVPFADLSFNWVVAHNPASFYPALRYSQKANCKLGIDVEDYHPGETNSQKDSKLMKLLMKKILPFAHYCSYAAPLIAKEVQADIPEMKNKQLVLLNGFSGEEFREPEQTADKPLQLVWFSQNITANRGLEYVVDAVNELHPFVQLHLIGNLRTDFFEERLKQNRGIIIHKPMPQKELHRFLAVCDIGIASDVPVDRNRELALTNKIIAYVQAGLPVFTFPVHAQVSFLQAFGLQHYVCDNSKEAIVKTLQSIDRSNVNGQKKLQYLQAGQLQWEQLSVPLAHIWKQQ